MNKKFINRLSFFALIISVLWGTILLQARSKQSKNLRSEAAAFREQAVLMREEAKELREKQNFSEADKLDSKAEKLDNQALELNKVSVQEEQAEADRRQAQADSRPAPSVVVVPDSRPVVAPFFGIGLGFDSGPRWGGRRGGWWY